MIKTILNTLTLAIAISLAANAGMVYGSDRSSMPLAMGGNSMAVIVLAEDATETERTAARELAEHLEAVTGAEFRVKPENRVFDEPRIIIGPTAEARRLLANDDVRSWGPEDFVVRSYPEANVLMLTGMRPRGSLYAVYSFLENDIGVRWLTFYDDIYIPERNDLKIGRIDRFESPAFEVRDIIVRTNRMTAREEIRDFLVRNRAQGPELTTPGIEDMESFGGVSHRYIRREGAPNYFMIHTLHRFMRPADYFDENPEFFSYDKSRDRWVPRQLNFSNPEMKETLTKRILESIEADGGEGLLSVTLMDVGGEISDDEESMRIVREEGTSGAPLLKYIAEDLAPVVAREYPNVTITTLAYRQSRIPPKNIRFPDNVQIVWAPIGSDFGRPLTHPSNKEDLEYFKAWREIAPEMWVWYYPAPYREPLDFNFLTRFAEDFRLFKEYNVEGLFLQTGGPGDNDRRRMASMRHWVMTKLMWDPYQSTEELAADFAYHYYGPAADIIMQYVKEFEEASLEAGKLGWDTNLDSYRFMTAERIARWQSYFDRALEVTADEPLFSKRVEYARMSLDHATLRKWSLLSLGRLLPYSREEVADRYVEAYKRSWEDRRIDHQLRQRAETTHALTLERLEGLRGLQPLDPLPARFDGIDESRISQITPDGISHISLRRDHVSIVPDKDAAGGVAVRFKLPEKEPPVKVGYYERGGSGHHDIFIDVEDIQEPGYNLYHVSYSPLSDIGYMWTSGWHVQFHDTKYLFDPENPKKRFNTYISMKFTGPAFEDDVPEGEPNLGWIDRIILVSDE